MKSDRGFLLFRIPLLSRPITYRMNSPCMAVLLEGDRRSVRTIPAQAIVTLKDETVDNNGLVKVMWEGTQVMMFTDDLRKHGQKINQI